MLLKHHGILPAFVDERIVSGVTTRIISDDLTKLAHVLGCDAESIIHVKQVHGATIRVIDAHSQHVECDGCIAQESDVVLGVRIADCAGVLLWDPVTSTIAAVHSGWRGTRRNIVGKCVQRMKTDFDCNPADIRAYISPCASGDRYEVGVDVASKFPGHVRQIRPDTWLYDNRSAIGQQLVNAGVKPVQICGDPICTIADERFHSYRRDGAAAGRCFAFIGLHKSSSGS